MEVFLSTRAHTVPKFYLNGFVAPGSEASPDPFLFLGSVATHEVKRRSPKNISIKRGLYDGPGGFTEPDKTIEEHLSRMESEAAVAIRNLTATSVRGASGLPSEIMRFLAWQAARTPRWLELVQSWSDESPDGCAAELVEEPPSGFEEIRDRFRSLTLEEPGSGRRVEAQTQDEFDEYRKKGWRWVLKSDDYLEMMHLQAWYFQIRHFRRLSWVTLQPPDGEFFIASDRGVAWLVDGLADTPPAALRHPSTQVIAPLTRSLALVGRHATHSFNATTREVNRLIACLASEWIVGPTQAVVDEALRDRAALYQNQAANFVVH